MNSTLEKPLLVLNASAGSGKTYNLVRNYLRLLLQDGEDRAELNQILAMTFTNKASIEMKTRIIQDLDKLAFGTTEKEEKFRAETADYIGVKKEFIQTRAQQVLKRILHQYEDFQVSTIDKFNLKLIRSFARDLELPDNFEIVVNDAQVLNLAIDRLLDNIDEKQQDKIYNLALRFVRDKLESEDSWDIRKILRENSQQLTNERYFDEVKSLTNYDLKEENLKEWKAAYEAEILIFKAKSAPLKEVFEALNLSPDNFHSKGNTFNAIVKLLKAAEIEKPKLSELLPTEAALKNIGLTIEKEKEMVFSPQFLQLTDWLETNQVRWRIEELKISQFYFLAILRELALTMDEIRNRDAIIRVSEFNQLVAELVRNEDAPYIYERLGSRYKHFFLDEFQDTSRLQWLNLVPLVHNSVAENKFNFIVGDPKQSIYRFKNGVAEQFVALPEIYNPENDPKTAERSAFFKEMGQVKSLEENWRSAQEIVAFNNQFFTDLKQSFPEFGKQHYQFVSQLARGKAGGYISCEFYRDKKTAEADGDLLSLKKWVEQVLAKGYQPSDICILSKKKETCNKYALFLKSLGYQVVSADSLMVNSDESVQLVIEFLKWKADPENQQLQMQFGFKLLLYLQAENRFSIYKNAFEQREHEGKYYRFFNFNRLLEAINLSFEVLNSLPFQNIYSVINGFLRLIHIDPLENAYLFQLLDMAYKFDNSNGPVLEDFIVFYEDSGYKTNVVLPETSESIQIMTAHKSKGLEFPIVMIPSFNFQGINQLQKESKLFAGEQGVYTAKFTSANAIIGEVDTLMQAEKDNQLMDAVNLLYVAFTRAVDALFIGGLATNDLEKQIVKVVEGIAPVANSNPDKLLVEIGQFPERTEKHGVKTKQFESESLQDLLWFPDISVRGEDSFENDVLEDARILGKLFHKIMEHSQTKEEALSTMERIRKQQEITEQYETSLKQFIDEAFSNEAFSELLKQGKHLNEQSILISEFETIRPDKLILGETMNFVIDFKTGEPKKKDVRQVQNYMTFLQEILAKPVKGYLYYVGGKGLEEVGN